MDTRFENCENHTEQSVKYYRSKTTSEESKGAYGQSSFHQRRPALRAAEPNMEDFASAMTSDWSGTHTARIHERDRIAVGVIDVEDLAVLKGPAEAVVAVDDRAVTNFHSH